MDFEIATLVVRLMISVYRRCNFDGANSCLNSIKRDSVRNRFPSPFSASNAEFEA